ncbi:Succinoglycan biosynthesis protein ExoL [Clarias magur]|uniref:Succinoglycan biosynthesis protein ExoL n=1 Tax=Clarias magur TaxID=1594786 RepID=A0A8J4XHG6_CLAMG|nr:Succinoglycan biosynthesis protein ExoL [Clarias magur]
MALTACTADQVRTFPPNLGWYPSVQCKRELILLEVISLPKMRVSWFSQGRTLENYWVT